MLEDPAAETSVTETFAPFAAFLEKLPGDHDAVLAALRAGLIGEGVPVPGPFGEHPLLYADYVASGRALRQIEDFMAEQVLPYYGNSHTEASYCGGAMTRLREAARRVIAHLCGADQRYATIFTGSGATAGLNRLVSLLGVPEAVAMGRRPVVFVGPYEHHSNLLPWRESGAEVIEIAEATTGGPDLGQLAEALAGVGEGRLKIGAFSVASNVTGIVSDADAVTRLLKQHGALAVWDYAGGGPYLPIDLRAGSDAQKDAIALSPHKFLGGPGASGLLLIRQDLVTRDRPVLPGGGTVRFVSPWVHDYVRDVTTREEAGTPNILGDIRAALCFLVKRAIGQDYMDQRHHSLRRRALARWQANPHIQVVGNPQAAHCLPIFSLIIHDPRHSGVLHQNLFTRLLSDCHGIQARGGCACAGPYGHRLLDIKRPQSEAIRQQILAGHEINKPGWTRLNFSYLWDDTKADRVIDAVDELARNPYPMCQRYRVVDSEVRLIDDPREVA